MEMPPAHSVQLQCKDPGWWWTDCPAFTHWVPQEDTSRWNQLRSCAAAHWFLKLIQVKSFGSRRSLLRLQRCDLPLMGATEEAGHGGGPPRRPPLRPSSGGSPPSSTVYVSMSIMAPLHYRLSLEGGIPTHSFSRFLPLLLREFFLALWEARVRGVSYRYTAC